MSGGKCKNCGSTNIETDPARGDAVCTECGFVLEDQIIVSETAFEETPSGNMMMLGQFVSNESSGGATGFGAGYLVSGKESREITLQNARKGITHLCRQLQLNQHCIDTSVNFYKMALNRHLTRGRKQAHNHAACVYITCRTEGTAHMLIDISDVLQICVHELGRTYLRFTQALCINIPSVDPCLYIMRFANKLEFGDKTHEVSMTALRVVQRMKRDNIHSGRRPSGLCGAALLMAARLHEFNRSPGDIIRIVKVHESTLRKRLIEFGDTPSSALTLDEFMTVDLEEEQDPPAFKAARKKDRERIQKVDDLSNEISELQSEIDRQLEEQKTVKGKTKDKNIDDETCADAFVRESNMSVIESYVEGKSIDTAEILGDPMRRIENPLSTGLGPDIASMGLTSSFQNKENKTKEPSTLSFENLTGEIDITDLDDEELDSYIMSEKEAQFKSTLWNKVNEKYLQDQKGEAIEKMLQEKRISTKINYEVLKSLNDGTGSTAAKQKPPVPDDISFALPKKVDIRESPAKSVVPKKVQPRIVEVSKVVPNIKMISPRKREASQSDSGSVPDSIEQTPTANPAEVYDANHETDDDYLDEEVEPEPDPSEMSVGQLLRQQDEDGDYGYEYEEEDYC
ncbi:hypothetical protein QAD02_004381 [Eretmocerus hayati]|uniref:Uncharacterized protein n=1 Tax=Eretmocerus hayati TaxID=131215 RepID=A0ACC2NPE4_9HYME|nr:hypothetical protein QAD02_004381 [Eretmocerus hayati]